MLLKMFISQAKIVVSLRYAIFGMVTTDEQGRTPFNIVDLKNIIGRLVVFWRQVRARIETNRGF